MIAKNVKVKINGKRMWSWFGWKWKIEDGNLSFRKRPKKGDFIMVEYDYSPECGGAMKNINIVLQRTTNLQIKILEVIEKEENISVQEVELALILCLKEIKEDQL